MCLSPGIRRLRGVAEDESCPVTSSAPTDAELIEASADFNLITGILLARHSLLSPRLEASRLSRLLPRERNPIRSQPPVRLLSNNRKNAFRGTRHSSKVCDLFVGEKRKRSASSFYVGPGINLGNIVLQLMEHLIHAATESSGFIVSLKR